MKSSFAAAFGFLNMSSKNEIDIEKAGYRRAYQPPDSPDLIPFEHFWHHLKLKIESSKQKFNSLFDFILYALAK